MKRRKVEGEQTLKSNEYDDAEESWRLVKKAVQSSQNDWREMLLSYLRSQNDETSAREKVLKEVNFQFLTQILASYNATTSEEDRQIFDALELLENTYKINMNMISPIVWGEESVEIYRKRGQLGGTLSRTTPEQILELLDGMRMWNTVLNHSRSVVTDSNGDTRDGKVLYDVRFLLRLFLSMMHPGSELKYRSFVERNGLALAFSCTSSIDITVRRLAYCVLQKFLTLLHELDIDTADDRYKNLYVYLLRILKQSIETEALRLPHMVSHFFARVSKLILHPESPVYPAVLSFFILKPVIDLNNVPEFYKLLLSSSADYHNQEREWILTLILDALIEPRDYNVLQSRSGIKVMLCLFTTCMVDMVARRLILSILKAAVQMPTVAHDLFYRMNLQSWIASVIKSRDLSVWEQCFLGQIYSILIESERKTCRSAEPDPSKKSYLVAQASARITSKVVLYVMEAISHKQIAEENVQSIKTTLDSKWRPKRKKQESS
nr:LOC443605 protein [Haemonchus contortus]